MGMMSHGVYSLPDKIKDLLKAGTVSPMTRLALVNAIYFKGDWLNRFNAADTKEMTFTVNTVNIHKPDVQLSCSSINQNTRC